MFCYNLFSVSVRTLERGWSETLRSLWTRGSMQRNSWRDKRYRKQMEVKIHNYYIVISAKANRCLRDSASDAEIRCVVWRQHAGIDGNISWLFSHLAFYETNAGLIAAGVLSSVPHQSPVWRVWSQHLQTQSGLWGDDIVPVRLAIFVSMTKMTSAIPDAEWQNRLVLPDPDPYRHLIFFDLPDLDRPDTNPPINNS